MELFSLAFELYKKLRVVLGNGIHWRGLLENIHST